MRPPVRRLAAAFAAAHLLAGWLAAALHSHAAPAGHVEGATACTTCSCGHHHGGPEGEAPGDSEPEHGHGCVVCQYLAQPPLAVEPVRLVTAPEPAAPAAVQVAPDGEVVTASAWWGRGPPAA